MRDINIQKKKKYIIIHGHFYQPPRENPWSGMIPRQSSAGKHHNWNSRITAECYSANSSSRILNSHGEIEGINNNYSQISYNIGPTLFSWMEDHAPDTMKRIIQADQDSRKRFGGHGNALAQSYNHSILPLADSEDLITQLVWGKQDFKARYKREPEGIWLPEMAVNEKVLNQLIDMGFQYTLLSPFQGDSIRERGSSTWQALDKEMGAPCDRSFFWQGKKGQISIFFYDAELASGISFQHFLKDAESLMDRIEERYNMNSGNLLSIATDGEIYGHHEPFGDMCLAALLKKIESHETIKLTNYGEYLELFPAQWELRLKKGEDHRGSSWSCVHGVSRWYKDCGCFTGGEALWNQNWRAPLRQGFERLNGEIKKVFTEQIKKICKTDPFTLRKDYGRVLSGQVTRESFIDEHLESPNEEKAKKILSLLESQRYSQFMFTSCGWFFNDLSGIEPVQNMKYAARAIQLSQKYSEKDLSKLLSHYLKKGKSNIPEKGNGWELYREEAITDYQHVSHSAALFLFKKIYELPNGPSRGNFNFYNLILRSNEKGFQSGSLQMDFFQTGEEYKFHFQLNPKDQDQGEYLWIQNEDDSKAFNYFLDELPKELRELIYLKKRKETLLAFKSTIPNYLDPFLDLYEEHNRILPEGDGLTIMTLAAMVTLNTVALLERVEDDGLQSLTIQDLSQLDKLLSYNNLQQEKERIQNLCSNIIAFEVECFLEYMNPERIDTLHRFVQILWNNKVSAVKAYSQNLVFEAFRKKDTNKCFENYMQGKEEKDKNLLISMIEKLGEIMNIDRSVLIESQDL